MAKCAVFIISILVLSGCTSALLVGASAVPSAIGYGATSGLYSGESGERLTKDKLDKIQVGRSEKAELLGVLGEPTSINSDPSGVEIYQWRYSNQDAGLIPGWTEYESETSILQVKFNNSIAVDCKIQMHSIQVDSMSMMMGPTRQVNRTENCS